MKNGSTLWGCLEVPATESASADGLQELDTNQVHFAGFLLPTDLAWMGAIPAGTSPDDVIEGAGIVNVMKALIFSGLGLATKAPIALISKVLASSMNCSPWASFPRMNNGTL